MSFLSTADTSSTPSAAVAVDHMFRAFGDEGLSGVGYVRRAFARVIDLVILNVAEAVAVIFFTAGALVMTGASGTAAQTLVRRIGETTLSSVALALLAAVAYFTVFEGLWGSTPGKRVMGLVVVSEDVGPCSLAAACKRNVAFLLEMLCGSIPAALAIAGSPRAQRHGDRWAGTIVPVRASVPAPLLGTPASFVLACIGVIVTTAVTMGLTVLVKALMT